MSDITRPFPFRVRRHPRETLESYTRRVLAANGEPAQLPATLLREAGLPKEKWAELLVTKTSAEITDKHLHNPRHRDKSRCEDCTALLPHRWACTLCTYGERVEQHPHFDDLVCVSHRRWVGLDGPELQHAVKEEHVAAAMDFKKLRRTGRIDFHLYTLVSNSLRLQGDQSEAEAFPATIGVIRAVTSAAFQRRLLTTSETYRDAYLSLKRQVGSVLGAESDDIIRVLWVALRPVFAAAREAARTGDVVKLSNPHTFPLTPGLRPTMSGPLPEPFTRYLEQSNDSLESAMRILAERAAKPRPERRLEHVCTHGHIFTVAATTKSPRCPVCPSTGTATPGRNDLATIAPHLVEEFDTTRNGQLTPNELPARSNKRVHWLCPKGHSYEATPANRVLNDLECPVCMNRAIRVGVNDFATLYPLAFSEWHHVASYNPLVHTPRTSLMFDFTCADGHTYRSRLRDIKEGINCADCRRLNSVAKRGALDQTHPALAREWVQKRGGKTPSDVSAGSGYIAHWSCPTGHDYTARVERRVAGTGCPYCAGRKLKKGFNDLATTHPTLAAEWHPYLNWKSPKEVFAGSNDKWHWRCVAGHETRQSVPHRILSAGCTQCPRPKRALSEAVSPASQGTHS